MKTENKGKKKGLRFYVDGRPSTITSILLEGKSTSINISISCYSHQEICVWVLIFWLWFLWGGSMGIFVGFFLFCLFQLTKMAKRGRKCKF